MTFLFLSVLPVTAQIGPPQASYFRSYVNDILDQPLITVTVTGAVDVACLTIEETLPAATAAVAVSGDGVFLPGLNSVRWGPYLNTSEVTVSYRLSAPPGSYPVTGGSWMDGKWFFQPGVTTVQVISTNELPQPPPPQLPSPVFMPPSGTEIPVNVVIGMPGSVMTLLADDWAEAVRTVQDPPYQSAWFASDTGTNLTVAANALEFLPDSDPIMGITYFAQHSNAPVALSTGDALKATLNLAFLGGAIGTTNGIPGLRIGLFNFSGSALDPTWVSADGFPADGQGSGVLGYSLFQGLGSLGTVDIKRRTNVLSSDLLGTTGDYAAMNGSTVSSNFPAFVAGREYVLTLVLLRVSSGSLSFSASWLDTVTGGVLSKTATDTAATHFSFDGLAIFAQSITNTATNITVSHFQVDYLPKAADGFPDVSGADIYYTLDGTPPTLASTLYTGAVHVATTTLIRAAAFTNSWTPSPASAAYYGQLATGTGTLVQRSVDTSSPSTPVITFNVSLGSNANCLTLTETLPMGVGATNVTDGGEYHATDGTVRWGPFFGTNSQTLSYEATGSPGTYPVRASWSVDGVSDEETAEAKINIAGCTGIECLPANPSPAFPPVLSPPSGADVPVGITMSSATPGAVIYYTLDGSVPTTNSLLYGGAVNLISPSTVRARAFADGFAPSSASVAYYGYPAPTNAVLVTRSVDTNTPSAPVVSIDVIPTNDASCFTVTEALPPALSVSNISAGGTFISGNNAVQWGPFFGTNVQSLSFQAYGPNGVHPTLVSWSVDGMGGSEPDTISVDSANYLPSLPLRVPTPVLSPPSTSGLPVMVSISCSDALADIYYTTDGTLPTPASTPYPGSLNINVKTTLRARAFRSGYVDSVAAVGDYVPVPTTNSLLLVRSVSDNGSLLPGVNLTATPQASMSCYSVTETLPSGLTPADWTAGGEWDPARRELRWGPFVDNQQRVLGYSVGGTSGGYTLDGGGSFDGFPASTVGESNVVVNAEYWGSPSTSFNICYSNALSYDLTLDPVPGQLIIDGGSVNGTVFWGDGTSNAVTQPVMNFVKYYSAVGTYLIGVDVNWSGQIGSTMLSGHSTRTDTVYAVSCDAPEIVVQPHPTNQTVLVGGTAQISVTATSSLPMVYQWYFNETTPILSAPTIETLTLDNIRPEAAGSYLVVITNSIGSVTSDLAFINVLNPLITGITLNSNGSVTLDFSGLPNSTTRTWAATNLKTPIFWQPISTNNADSGGIWQVIDNDAPLYPVRFYRFSTP